MVILPAGQYVDRDPMLPKDSGKAILAESAPLPRVELVTDTASPIDGSDKQWNAFCLETVCAVSSPRRSRTSACPMVGGVSACGSSSPLGVLVRAYVVRGGVLVLAYSTQH